MMLSKPVAATGSRPCSGTRLPVSISYSTQPSAYISVRASAGLPSHCSGDVGGCTHHCHRYCGVGRVDPSQPEIQQLHAELGRQNCPVSGHGG
jgi:hypothetical protein